VNGESTFDRSVNFDKEIELPILNQDKLYVLQSCFIVCIIHLNSKSEAKNGLESLKSSTFIIDHLKASTRNKGLVSYTLRIS
jgi:hypothetical protein